MKRIIGEEGFLNIYTDRSCINNGKQTAVAGVGIWIHDNLKFNISQLLNLEYVTNNQSEL